MTQNNKKLLIICIAIPVMVGLFGAALVNFDFGIYKTINKPAFAPPAIIFPIVWTVLYTLMGVSSYLVNKKKTQANETDVIAANIIYALSLLLNIIWVVLFFGFLKFAAAFATLVMLIITIFATIFSYAKISKAAAIIQIPYLLWCIFAAFLNLSVYAMN